MKEQDPEDAGKAPLWAIFQRHSESQTRIEPRAGFFLDGVPIGALVTYGETPIPDGYLLSNGAAISRTVYARLFAVYGTKYGAGDGSTTFNIRNVAGSIVKY